MSEKVCSKCGKKKLLAQFYRDGNRYRAECMDCTYDRMKRVGGRKVRRPSQFKPSSPNKKICSACLKEKDLSEFSRNGKTYRSQCKQCKSEQHQVYKDSVDPEIWKARIKSSREKNIEHSTEWRKAYQPTINAQNREKYHNDAEYRQNFDQYQSQYRAEHPEMVRNTTKNHREANRARYTSYTMNYNARKLDATAEDVDYRIIQVQSDGVCYICEKQILPHHGIEFDHVIPLSRQGPHSYENIKMVHQCCNSRKHNKLISEMTPYQRRGPDN